MELDVFVRMHVREGLAGEAEEAIREVLGPSREEAGFVSIHAYRSVRDGRLFYIHSKWKDEEAFEAHAKLAHTVKFVGRMEKMIGHPWDLTRSVEMR